MSEVKNSALLDLDPTSFSFGMKVRYCRIRIGMHAERLAFLYAQAMGQEEPYTRRRIEQMEQNDDFPQNPYRRWVIANIVNMGACFDLNVLGLVPSALGLDFSHLEEEPEEVDLQIRGMKFDLEDHQAFLKRSWTQGFQGTLVEAEEEILDRIHDIDLKNSYVNAQQTKQARRTLCGLHILLATDIYGAQNNGQGLAQQTRLAALLAQENRFPDLYAIVRFQRGSFLHDQGRYLEAFNEFQAVRNMKNLPQQLRGMLLSQAGTTKVRMACTESDNDEVQALLDEAEGLINGSSLEDFDFFVVFDDNRYRLSRGGALIRSPVKALRNPTKALSYLPTLYRADAVTKEDFQTVGHRQVANHIYQAEIAIEQGEYTQAVTLAQEALEYSERLQSKAHLKKLVRIYSLLKRSPEGESESVRLLEVRLARNLFPERFRKRNE